MYIAGRLRTASMPPKTLMDVASYLCPAPLPPADSFSAMSRASPQTARSYDCKILNAWWYTGRRSRGRLDTYLAHWPLHPEIPAWTFVQGAFALARLEGLRLHPVPFRNFRGDAAKLLFSSAKRHRPSPAGPFALARARKLERVRVGQCRSGGIQNNKILPENRHFHKVIVRA